MPTKSTTRKQRECSHPAAWVHPTFDDHFEICDLCRTIRPRPLPAPWIVAHDLTKDEGATPPPAPALFAAPAPATVPVVAATVPPRRPKLTGSDPDDPRYLRECPRCDGTGKVTDHAEALRAVPGLPPLPTQRHRETTARTCPRCQGKRKIGTYDPHGAPTLRRPVDQIA